MVMQAGIGFGPRVKPEKVPETSRVAQPPMQLIEREGATKSGSPI